MKNIYILDEHISSQKNGIGTFLRQLIDCCKKWSNIYLLRFNANVKEFTLSTSEHGVKQMLFPAFQNGSFVQNGRIVLFFLNMYIKDSIDNLFFVNHSPCSDLLSRIKSNFPLSKIVFCIHDMGWTFRLLGDCNSYRRIVQNKDKEAIQMKHSALLNIYAEEKRMYDLADKVLCLSEDTLELLRTLYMLDEKKVCYIPNGLKDCKRNKVDCSYLRKSMFVEEQEQILLFVGRVTESKGVIVLVEAFKKVLLSCPCARLVIAGNVNFVELEKLLKCSSSIAPRVTVTGLLDKDSLYKWYSIAQVGVIPSYYEQCSYVGIEMLMYGLPIVAVNNYGVRNMFHDGINAKMISACRQKRKTYLIDKLAAAIVSLLKSDSEREILAEKARNYYENHYQVQRMENEYKFFIESL